MLSITCLRISTWTGRVSKWSGFYEFFKHGKDVFSAKAEEGRTRSGHSTCLA